MIDFTKASLSTVVDFISSILNLSHRQESSQPVHFILIVGCYYAPKLYTNIRNLFNYKYFTYLFVNLFKITLT